MQHDNAMTMHKGNVKLFTFSSHYFVVLNEICFALKFYEFKIAFAEFLGKHEVHVIANKTHSTQLHWTLCQKQKTMHHL